MENSRALLIFARFAEANNTAAFGTGLESWVAAELPDVQLLDLDSDSGKPYVLQLSEAAATAPAFALWLKPGAPDLPLGAIAGLLETWLRFTGPKLLALQGEHNQAERMGRAQTGWFCKGKYAEEITPEVEKFFRSLIQSA